MEEKKKEIGQNNYCWKNLKSTFNQKQNNKGITIIALVVTIIVILILALVSITLLTGKNGVITKANQAKAEQARQAAYEKVLMAWNEVMVNPEALSADINERIMKFYQQELKDYDKNSYISAEVDNETVGGYVKNNDGTYTINIGYFEGYTDFQITVDDLGALNIDTPNSDGTGGGGNTGGGNGTGKYYKVTFDKGKHAQKTPGSLSISKEPPSAVTPEQLDKAKDELDTIDLGYEFKGWYTDSTFKTKYNGDAITSDTTLYANYTCVGYEDDKMFIDKNGNIYYYVLFYVDDVKKETRKIQKGSTIIKSASISMPENPTKENFEFIKWLDRENETTFDENTEVNNFTEVDAQWKDKTAGPFEVYFNLEGGLSTNNSSDKIEVEKGKKIPKPEDPTKTDFIFAGWYYEDIGLRKEYDFDNQVTKDITLYAKWAKEQDYFNWEILNGYAICNGFSKDLGMKKYNQNGFQTLEIPSSYTYDSYPYPVRYIGANAFKDCTNINTLKIPDSVRGLKRDAFYNCSSIKNLKMPVDLNIFADVATSFTECNNIVNYTFTKGEKGEGCSLEGDCIVRFALRCSHERNTMVFFKR